MSHMMQPADLDKLISSGVLMAANVNFFHALGLNLDIIQRDNKNTLVITGTEDPEGVLYSKDVPSEVEKLIKERQKAFAELKSEKHKGRKAKVGFVEQEVVPA